MVSWYDDDKTLRVDDDDANEHIGLCHKVSWGVTSVRYHNIHAYTRYTTAAVIPVGV